MKILLFLGLKVTEISVIIFIPYWLGRLMHKIPFFTVSKMPCWITGFFGIIMLIVAFGIVFIIIVEILPTICRANWRWVGKILQKEEK